MLRRSTRNSKKSASTTDPSSSKTNSEKSIKKTKKVTEESDSSDSDDVFIKPPKKEKKPTRAKRKITSNSSSSESDIENYLKPADEIDLNSSFFQSKEVPAFEKIEKEIFSGITVTRLSESESSSDDETGQFKASIDVQNDKTSVNVEEKVENKEEIEKCLKEGEKAAALSFQKLQDYNKKIEEAKQCVENYKAKQSQNVEKEVKTEEKIDINDLLAIGETKTSMNEAQDNSEEYSHSSDSDPYADSGDDWEEINLKQEKTEKSLVPLKELEIRVEMPGQMRKKKGDDLLAAIKRRLNRIRKENQVLIHKVHLLCWIAHGNFVNSVLNDQTMMALGLSLIPSEKSYPSGRIDLSYLEQILKWYKKLMSLNEKVPSKSKSLFELLTEQIEKKEAYTKKMLVLIFIIILRSLGIQCRLVLSLQVESLRPPNTDLHSLSKVDEAKLKKNNGDKSSRPSTSKIKNEVEENSSENEEDHKLKSSSKSTANKKRENTKSRKSTNSVTKKISAATTKNTENQENTPKKEENNESKSKSSSNATEKSNANKGVGENTQNKRRRNESKQKTDNSKDKKNDKQKDDVNSKITSKDRKTTENDEQKDDVKSKNSSKDRKTSESVSKTTSNKTLKNESVKSTKNQEKSKDASEKRRSTRSKSSKDETDTKSKSNNKSKTLTIDSDSKRSKSTSSLKLKKIHENHSKIRSKSSSNTKKSKDNKITQLDGNEDELEDFRGFDQNETSETAMNINSFENFYAQMYNQISKGIESRIPQLDGANDESPPSKPNLKRLKEPIDVNSANCKSKRHGRNAKKPNNLDRSTSDVSDSDFEESPAKKSKKLPSKPSTKVDLSKLQNYKSKKDSSSENSPKKVMDVTRDIMQLVKGRISEQKQIDKSKTAKKRKSTKHDDESDDSDFVPESIQKKYHSDSDDEFRPKMKVKQRVQVKKIKQIKLKKPKNTNSRKVISSDSEYTEDEIIEKKVDKEKVKKKKGNDTWLEVFLETEEKWISVDVIFGQVHCVNELYSRASHPVSYILGWDNNSHLKDISRRYCQNFNTVTRKLRIDSQWWEESLKPFLGPKNARDKEEDEELDRQQLEKPLPTTISEYKNHPLYVLERHLLKFEALYPPNAPPLGYVRNEPVYSRDCVHVCHSRDIWLKEAKVVKIGEKPYKIVKARPKYDKLSNKMITDQMLETFGPWQVEDYDPPTAENGIVPRNAYGNVDLFKPSMLPKKCVHLRLPGLNKVAKKMNIDCASAIVGFDFHGGWSHPVCDGFVVCEEYEDHLIAAWNIEQEEMERKEKEKYEARVYGNWKKLIKGLLIKERLKAKYGFGKEEDKDKEESAPKPGGSKRKSKGPSFCTKKRRVISDSSSGDEK